MQQRVEIYRHVGRISEKDDIPSFRDKEGMLFLWLENQYGIPAGTSVEDRINGLAKEGWFVHTMATAGPMSIKYPEMGLVVVYRKEE